MTETAIQNEFTSTDLDVIALQDPEQITLLRDSMATQLNEACAPPTIRDLSSSIADIRLQTSVQGAAFIEVDVIDPNLAMLMSGFITTDEDGFLFPPVDLVFPPGSNLTWTLVQCRPSTPDQGGQANLTLQLEDSIVTAMRNMDVSNGGVNLSNPGETLAGWIDRLVKATNRVMHTKIQLVQMISPKDPNYTPPTLPNAAALPKAHYQKKLDPATVASTSAQLTAAKKAYDEVLNVLGIARQGEIGLALGSQPTIPTGFHGG